MWLPASAQEVIDFLPQARENVYLDFKRELPPSSRNDAIAIDVSAMSIEGGVIIYGVAENKEAGTFSASPIELAGVPERIDGVVRSRVGPLLAFDIIPLLVDSVKSPGTGFVIVHVPQSPHAPHNVEGCGMYGRSATGNKLLSQGEIDRLYARRAQWAISAEERIQRIRSLSDFHSSTLRTPGVLRLLVSPITGITTFREDAGIGEDGHAVIDFGVQARNALDFRSDAAISLSCINYTRTQRIARGIRLVPGTEFPGNLVELEVHDDGTIVMSHGGVIDLTSSPDNSLLDDASVGQLVAQTLAMAGLMYSRAGLSAAVDIAMSLEGVNHSESSWWLLPGISFTPLAVPGRLREDVIVESIRTSTKSLLPPQSVDEAKRLVGPTLRALRMRGWPDPLELC